jgi:triacylglycerol lipase
MTVITGTLLILAALLAVAATLCSCAALVSLALAWRHTPRRQPVAPGLALRLVGSEAACLLATLVLRPCGWGRAAVATGPARRTPVILLHGLFQNRSCLFLLQWRLRAAGYDRVVSLNTPAWQDLESLVDAVAVTVARVRHASGAARVHLVGHSMGGILARCYLQRPDSAGTVAGCVTLGTPHRGTRLAPFAISRHGRSLGPASPLLARLNRSPLPAGVHFTAIYSRHDNIIVPAEHARMQGADNVEMTGLGHTTLLFSRQTADAVVAALQSEAGDSGLGARKAAVFDQSPVPSPQPLESL